MADHLRTSIRAGKYQPGDRLPSVRELATQFEVASATASRALDLLRRDGLVTSRPGLGTIVRDGGADHAPTVQEQLDDLRQRVEALEARES
jgi:DNA-binding GntR family transcriptional regulator